MRNIETVDNLVDELNDLRLSRKFVTENYKHYLKENSNRDAALVKMIKNESMKKKQRLSYDAQIKLNIIENKKKL